MTARIPDAQFHKLARVITHSAARPDPGKGTVLIAAAGTADLPVAEEAAVSAEVMGNTVDRLYDVGVAGLHRLLAEHARLTAARVVIVVAGMEGALPSVVGGLVDVPVIAVPTSVGYGASFGGLTALLGDAEQLRQRGFGREHRQRLRRGRHRQFHQPSGLSLVNYRLPTPNLQGTPNSQSPSEFPTPKTGSCVGTWALGVPWRLALEVGS